MMISRSYLKTVIFIIFIIFIIIVGSMFVKSKKMTTPCQETELIEMSKLLKKAHKKIGRLECEKNSN